MSFLQAVWLAWDTIRVQKLKSFFTVIGVTIGVTFLIAVVSIVGGMSRYMEDDLVGKLIAVNSFSLRSRPNFQMGDATQARAQRVAPPAAHPQRLTFRRSPRRSRQDVLWAVESSDNLKVESPYGSPRRTQMLDGLAGLVRDQEDGRVAGPADQRAGVSRRARRSS